MHLVPVGHQLVDPDGRDRHPVLVVLDFLRYADPQRALLQFTATAGGRRHVVGATYVTLGLALSPAAVRPASPIARSTLRQVSRARSSSDQPRSASAASSRG